MIVTYARRLHICDSRLWVVRGVIGFVTYPSPCHMCEVMPMTPSWVIDVTKMTWYSCSHIYYCTIMKRMCLDGNSISNKRLHITIRVHSVVLCWIAMTILKPLTGDGSSLESFISSSPWQTWTPICKSIWHHKQSNVWQMVTRIAELESIPLFIQLTGQKWVWFTNRCPYICA